MNRFWKYRQFKKKYKIFIYSFNQYSELNTKDNQLRFNDDSYNLSIIPYIKRILI